MNIGIVQYNPEWEKIEDNISSIESIISKELSDEDILVFPEMTLTGFTMESEKFAEELDGIGTKYFMSLAARTKKNIFSGLIEKDEGKIYNTLVHFDDQGLIRARYRKIHPFTYAKEDKFYNTNKETLITKIDQVQFGLSVCYDLRFPELYRFYGKERVEIMINVANWPVKRIEHWKHLLKARAIENQCFMIGVNRVGTDPFNEYNGRSAIYDPMGEEILMCDASEGLFSAEIDLSRINELRDKLPFLNDIKLI